MNLSIHRFLSIASLLTFSAFSYGQHVPLRSVIGLSDQYGATIQVDFKKIPKFSLEGSRD